MPPRLRCTASARGLTAVVKPSRPSAALLRPSTPAVTSAARQYATVSRGLSLPDDYVPPTKPPTARPGETRKAQLLRTYTSLLRTTPVVLLFQHNNLTAEEWIAVRRELKAALDAVPATGDASADIASKAKIQVVRTSIFDVAMKLVEFFDPSKVEPTSAPTATGKRVKVTYNHDLSKAAWKAVKSVTMGETKIPETSTYAQLSALMVGPVAAFTLPSVSPQHLAAALSILAPSPPQFPAPTRKKNPGYHEPITQSALQKLLLIGARIEDKAFDMEGVKWVGGIDNGLDGLRAQLVHMLQSAGMGLTSTLEGAGKALWLTMESRRTVLEEEQNAQVPTPVGLTGCFPCARQPPQLNAAQQRNTSFLWCEGDFP
ncbi:hypothetical protein QC764_600880 [Podospora pseudoanserina]|uniref:Ribosomal protein YmL11, mitochondrial n=1 Tax=Podospora pseudoanserina TaxID=2609844 RepID=A0ABR0HU15_9PEZI|nr:hypothetical protein QC764_600880 [Podospora pseudoanserina]